MIFPFQTSTENITQENQEFIKEIVQDKIVESKEQVKELVTNNIPWRPNLQRTGVIAKKIGIYPLWLKNGTKIHTTLLQVGIIYHYKY